MELKAPNEIATQDIQAPRAQAWATPRLSRLEASDAEAGANPINPEGAFATGS